jgi:hypothetical protein
MNKLKNMLPTSIKLSSDQIEIATNTGNLSDLLDNQSMWTSQQNHVLDTNPLTYRTLPTGNKAESIRPDLLKYQKIAQIKISTSLAQSSKRSQYQGSIAMDNCGRFASKTEHGLVALNRCNRRMCPTCTAIKGKRLTNDIIKCIDQIEYFLIDEADENTPQNKLMIGLKINLNTGSATTLDDLKTRLQIMHSIWARLLRTAKVQDALIGGFRSTEITQTDNNHANPHIHGLLLVKADTDLNKLSSHVRYYWHKTLKRELNKRKIKADVIASFGSLEPLYRHTKADIREWTRYATKGSFDYNKAEHRKSQLSTTARFWITVDEATKGMRLTSLNGSIKTAVALVRQQASESFNGSYNVYNQDYAWSDMKSAYIPYRDYSPDIDDKKAPLCQSLPYDRVTPHLGQLFKSEYNNHHIRRLEKRLESLGQKLLNTGNDSIYSQFDDLFIHNIKRSNTKASLDYTEPAEIERDSIKIRHKSPDSK